MVKVENVLVLFNERMGAMESALQKRPRTTRCGDSEVRARNRRSRAGGMVREGCIRRRRRRIWRCLSCLRYRENRTEAEAEARTEMRVDF